jgi:hypothetical protein
VLVVALMLVAFTALTVEAQKAERALAIIGKTRGARVAVGMDGATAVSAITERRGLRDGLASSGLRRGGGYIRSPYSLTNSSRLRSPRACLYKVLA